MTTDELARHLNTTYGIDKPWPRFLEVDKETFKNVLFSIYRWKITREDRSDKNHIKLTLGRHADGLLFKGVELILVDVEKEKNGR